MVMSPNQCCCRASNLIVSNAGFTTQGRTHQCVIADGDNTCGNITNTNINDFEKALDLIETSLYIHETPMVLGVHHPKKRVVNNITTYIDECSGNTPHEVNHFIVLIGIYYDNDRAQYYLRFYEVGTSVLTSSGTSAENRLYINYNYHIIKGNTAYVTGVTDYYTLIVVRINNEKYFISL